MCESHWSQQVRVGYCCEFMPLDFISNFSQVLHECLDLTVCDIPPERALKKVQSNKNEFHGLSNPYFCDGRWCKIYQKIESSYGPNVDAIQHKALKT